MTDAQIQALQQITQIMREHFDAGVVVVEAEMSGSDNTSDIRTAFHGGYAASLGLLEISKLRVWRKGQDESDD